jgi:hypothetical protein
MCKTAIFLLGFEIEHEDGGIPPDGTAQQGRQCFGARGAQGRGENGEETKGDSRACSPWMGKDGRQAGGGQPWQLAVVQGGGGVSA